jgi:hypothetical protein
VSAALGFEQRGMLWEVLEVLKEFRSRAEQLLASLALDLVLALVLVLLLRKMSGS